MDPDLPRAAHPGPLSIDVEAGRTYAWCACGRSAIQPFCDGSHAGTRFAPIEHRAERTRQLYFCGCKRTARPPFCDGSHNKL
jgi:CDGSH iron-sulfur domain-containing protein 3